MGSTLRLKATSAGRPGQAHHAAEEATSASGAAGPPNSNVGLLRLSLSLVSFIWPGILGRTLYAYSHSQD